jgi:hypothetical protein
MKNKKNIIGIIGEKEYKDIVTNTLISKGYCRISMEDKIKSISKIFGINNNLDDIRERGYKIGRLYWINLTLSNISNKKLIVIDDIRLEDIIENIMKVYYICDKEENMPKYIEPIYKNKKIEDFKGEVDKKFEALKYAN